MSTLVGATPVFVDVDPMTYNIDSASAALLEQRTQALPGLEQSRFHGLFFDGENVRADLFHRAEWLRLVEVPREAHLIAHLGGVVVPPDE